MKFCTDFQGSHAMTSNSCRTTTSLNYPGNWWRDCHEVSRTFPAYLRTNCNICDDPPNFYVAPSSGQNLNCQALRFITTYVQHWWKINLLPLSLMLFQALPSPVPLNHLWTCFSPPIFRHQRALSLSSVSRALTSIEIKTSEWVIAGVSRSVHTEFVCYRGTYISAWLRRMCWYTISVVSGQLPHL